MKKESKIVISKLKEIAPVTEAIEEIGVVKWKLNNKIWNLTTKEWPVLKWRSKPDFAKSKFAMNEDGKSQKWYRANDIDDFISRFLSEHI